LEEFTEVKSIVIC